MSTDAPVTTDPAPDGGAPKRAKGKMLVLSAIGALVLGGGGFAAGYVGVPGMGKSPAHVAAELPGIGFVAVDPIIISLGQGATGQHLRFAAHLEVPSEHVAEVELLKPRIVDVLNGYLRAVEMAELEDRAALVRLRAQMLRRIQMVTGEGRVRDVLVTEFVLS